jgi:hypothetical protein
VNYQICENTDDELRNLVNKNVLQWIRRDIESKIKKQESVDLSNPQKVSQYIFSSSRYAKENLESIMNEYEHFIGSYITVKEKYNTEKEKLLERRDLLGERDSVAGQKVFKSALLGGMFCMPFSYGGVLLGAGIVGTLSLVKSYRGYNGERNKLENDFKNLDLLFENEKKELYDKYTRN